MFLFHSESSWESRSHWKESKSSLSCCLVKTAPLLLFLLCLLLSICNSNKQAMNQTKANFTLHSDHHSSPQSSVSSYTYQQSYVWTKYVTKRRMNVWANIVLSLWWDMSSTSWGTRTPKCSILNVRYMFGEWMVQKCSKLYINKQKC